MMQIRIEMKKDNITKLQATLAKVKRAVLFVYSLLACCAFLF